MSGRFTVWMSVYRAGMPHHRLTGDATGQLHTACGRFISSPDRVQHGVLLPNDEAEVKGGRCEQCWPDGAS